MNNNNEEPEFVERRVASYQPPPPVTLEPRRFQQPLSPPFQRIVLDEDEKGGVYLRHFFDVIREHKWKIIAFMAIAMAATAGVTLFLKPLYKSTVKINVERRGNSGFVGQQATLQASGSDMDQVMTTQVEVLKSDSVLRPATEKYHLLDVEEQFTRLKPEEAARLRKAPIELKRLKVMRVPNTYLIEVSYEAPDPILAANVANTIAASYVEHAFDSRDRSYVQATSAIERQLKDLQSKMSASNKALTEFNKQMNIIDPEQRISMFSARLLQLNADYTSAQSDRLRKEAVLNSTKTGDLAAAEVSVHAESLQNLIDNLNGARQEFAVIRTQYAENHPEYKKAQGKLTELEAQFQEVRANVLARVQEDYNQALGREQMAYKLVGETKSEVDSLNNTASEYQQLKGTADNYKKLYEDLDRVTREEDINRSFQDSVIQIEDSARAAAKQTFPLMGLNLVLAFFVSGILGIAGAIMFETLDTKLRKVEDVAKLPNVDLIAALPKTKRYNRIGAGGRDARVIGKIPKSSRSRLLMQYLESIRVLRNNIDFAGLDRSLQSLLVTSASPAEGKSTIAANLAFSYALTGKKVLLIDADMRRPTLHTIFEKKVVHGLAELLEHKAEWDTALLKIAREHLFLLPAGQISDKSADLVGVEFQSILKHAQEEFDLVVLDSPPLLGAPEASQLAAMASGVLVVTRAGHSSVKKVEAAYSLLRRARANVIGMVMDDVADCGRVDSSYQTPVALPKSA